MGTAITGLAALGAAPATGDLIEIVDVSDVSLGAGGTNKKLQISHLFTSPSLTTPVLGVAAATTINKVTITAPATSATLTVAEGKVATVSNTLTLAGTDGSTLNVGTGGTLGTAAFGDIGTDVLAPDGSGASLTGLNAAELGSNIIPDARMPNLTGPVTTSEGAVATTMAVVLQIACSDETTDLTTGTGKVVFRMPHAMTLTEVRASVNTAPTGAVLIVDINEAGSTVLSTPLTMDAGQKSTGSAAQTGITITTAAVISDAALADNAEMRIDIDQVGASVAGKGLVVTLIGTRA
jgi:hypothetical protein